MPASAPSSIVASPGAHPARRPGEELRTLRPTLLVVGAILAAVAAATIVALATYGSSGTAVALSEYRIGMPTRLAAGAHTFVLDNRGRLPHELVVFRTDLGADALPVGADGDVDEESSQLHGVLDSGSSLRPGEQRTLDATLRPGHYVAVCNLANHYRLGMALDLTVTAR